METYSRALRSLPDVTVGGDEPDLAGARRHGLARNQSQARALHRQQPRLLQRRIADACASHGRRRQSADRPQGRLQIRAHHGRGAEPISDRFSRHARKSRHQRAVRDRRAGRQQPGRLHRSAARALSPEGAGLRRGHQEERRQDGALLAARDGEARRGCRSRHRPVARDRAGDALRRQRGRRRW